MEFYDIQNLKRDSNQDNLYNMFVVTFRDTREPSTTYRNYFVSEEQEMRMDLVSQLVYNTDEYVDLLCNMNQIDNPLNVMESDILYYPPVGVITSTRPEITPFEINNGLLQTNENLSEVDENRKKYIEQGYSQIPTVNDIPKEPIRVVGDTIIIGG